MTTKMALTWESSVRGNGDMCGDGELGKRQTRLLWVMVTEYAVELWGHWWVRVVFGNGGKLQEKDDAIVAFIVKM